MPARYILTRARTGMGRVQHTTVFVSKPLNLTSLTLHVLRRFLFDLLFFAKPEKWTSARSIVCHDMIKAIFFMRQESLLFWYAQTII